MITGELIRTKKLEGRIMERVGSSYKLKLKDGTFVWVQKFDIIEWPERPESRISH